MSEPLKKPNRTPESYTPKAVPEIIAMAEQLFNKRTGDDSKKKSAFQVDIFRIEQPLYLVGRSVRVTHGTPECFPKIDALIESFDADDAAGAIPNRVSPVIPFGVGLNHIAHGGDLIEFTYMRGILVREPPAKGQLPDDFLCHTIPAGYYARNRVRAKDVGEALGVAYVELDRWVKSSEEWEDYGDGGYEYEVFTSSVYSPKKRRFEDAHKPNRYTMEKWERVRRKNYE